jgi:hypothetical protein
MATYPNYHSTGGWDTYPNTTPYSKSLWETPIPKGEEFVASKPEIEFVTYALAKGKNPAFSVTHATTKSFIMDHSSAPVYNDPTNTFLSDYKLYSAYAAEYTLIAKGLKAVKGNDSIYTVSSNVVAKPEAGVLDLLVSHIMSHLPDAVLLNPALKEAIDQAVRKAFKIP